jgi:hypothetical protein
MAIEKDDTNLEGVVPRELGITSNASVGDVTSSYHTGRIGKTYFNPADKRSGTDKDRPTPSPSRTK